MTIQSTFKGMGKTVYILGAGFSIEANAPSQAALVRKIFEIHNTDPHVFQDTTAVEKFRRFLTSTLCVPAHFHHDVPLEDIFTPLDKCLADNISFRNLNVKGVRQIRETVYYLIGQTIEYLLRQSNREYIDLFADYLVTKSSVRINNNYRNTDPISVISTNWDIILDNAIKRKIDRNFYQQAVVDYCCHISSYMPDDETVKPGLEMLGKGGFNVKLLKLHGSLNWLQCPKCLRVFVDFDNKIAVNQYVFKEKCRHCDRNFGTQNSHTLLSNLIMPTYLKDLSNPQFKIIWQNAGFELSEADKIVFIGYSLPQADFELRQLFARMVKKNAIIEVVTYVGSDYTLFDELQKRYQVFFGTRRIKFYTDGAKQYILNLVHSIY